MKSLILYGSPIKLSKSHLLVTLTDKHPVGVNSKPQPPYYVRASVSNWDYIDAIEHARPKKGETVLNAVPLD